MKRLFQQEVGLNNTSAFRSETVNERLKRTLERNRPKPALKKDLSLGEGDASDLANATFDLPQVMRAKRLANREILHQAKERQTNLDLSFDSEDEDEKPAVRKPVKKAPASINYIKKEKKSRKTFASELEEGTRLSKGMVYVGWAVCFLLVLRLTFAAGGIIDNVKKATALSSKKEELIQVQEESVAISKEIELIQKNAAFQKKLVRDNLGFIASDEYLVLFQESKSPKTI